MNVADSAVLDIFVATLVLLSSDLLQGTVLDVEVLVSLIRVAEQSHVLGIHLIDWVNVSTGVLNNVDLRTLLDAASVVSNDD